MLKFVEPTNQLFEKLNENYLKDRNWSPSTDISNFNDNNFLDFLQKDSFFSNPTMTLNNDKTEYSHFKPSTDSKNTNEQEITNSQQVQVDNNLNSASVLGIYKQNMKKRSRKHSNERAVSLETNVPSKKDIIKHQNKIELNKVEKEGMVDPQEIKKNNEFDGVPGGENFSKIIQVENLNILNDKSNIPSNNTSEKYLQNMGKRKFDNTNFKYHINQTTNKNHIPQVIQKQIHIPSFSKVPKNHFNKNNTHNSINRNSHYNRRKIIKNNSQRNSNNGDINELDPPKLVKPMNRNRRRRRKNLNKHKQLKESGTSLYHSNAQRRRKRSFKNNYQRPQVGKSTLRQQNKRFHLPSRRNIPNNKRNLNNNRKVTKKKTNQKKQLVYRLDSNNKEIIALKKRINLLIHMNNKLLKQINTSPLLNQEKKRLSKQIVSFIQKVDKIKRKNLGKAKSELIRNYPSLRKRFENLEEQLDDDDENIQDQDEEF